MAASYERRRSKYLEEYTAQLSQSRPATARPGYSPSRDVTEAYPPVANNLARPTTSCGVFAQSSGWESDSDENDSFISNDDWGGFGGWDDSEVGLASMYCELEMLQPLPDARARPQSASCSGLRPSRLWAGKSRPTSNSRLMPSPWDYNSGDGSEETGSQMSICHVRGPSPKSYLGSDDSLGLPFERGTSLNSENSDETAGGSHGSTSASTFSYGWRPLPCNSASSATTTRLPPQAPQSILAGRRKRQVLPQSREFGSREKGGWEKGGLGNGQVSAGGLNRVPREGRRAAGRSGGGPAFLEDDILRVGRGTRRGNSRRSGSWDTPEEEEEDSDAAQSTSCYSQTSTSTNNSRHRHRNSITGLRNQSDLLEELAKDFGEITLPDSRPNRRDRLRSDEPKNFSSEKRPSNLEDLDNFGIEPIEDALSSFTIGASRQNQKRSIPESVT